MLKDEQQKKQILVDVNASKLLDIKTYAMLANDFQARANERLSKNKNVQKKYPGITLHQIYAMPREKQQEVVATGLQNTIIIIDEAHNFVMNKDVDFEGLYMPAIDLCRKGPNPVKIIAVTATPVYNNNPMVFMNILRLIGAQEQLDKFYKNMGTSVLTKQIYTKIPQTKEQFQKWLDPRTGTMSTGALQQIYRAIAGMVSYVNNTYDPRYFPQVSEDTTVKVLITDIQVPKYLACINGAKKETRAKKGAVQQHTYLKGTEMYDPGYYDQQQENEKDNEQSEYGDYREYNKIPRRRKSVYGRRGRYQDFMSFMGARYGPRGYSAPRGHAGPRQTSDVAETKTKEVIPNQMCKGLENDDEKYPAIGTAKFNEPQNRRDVVASLEDKHPKILALMRRINELDKQDISKGIIGKHCIWAHDGKTALKILSLLCLTGEYKCAQGQYQGGSNMGLDLETNAGAPNNIAFLSASATFLGLPSGIAAAAAGDDKETPRKKYNNIIMNAFNSVKNRHGKLIRFLIYDQSVSEGYNFYNVRHLHLFEPTRSHILDVLTALPDSSEYAAFKKFIDVEVAQRVRQIQATTGGRFRIQSRVTKPSMVQLKDLAYYQLKQDIDSVATQAIGRVRRFCGSKNLRFTNKGWELFISRYEMMVPAELTGGKISETGLPLSMYETFYNPDKQSISDVLVAMQLINLLQQSSIERTFPPYDRAPANAPHPLLGYNIDDYTCEPKEACE
jgi:hypothetical protein